MHKNKRRPTTTGRTSLFSGLVYCPDCGAKLHFAAAKSITRQQEHFRCANYKSGRGDCQVHFIRDKSSGHCYVKVDIYFTAVGMIEIPDEKEISEIISKIQESPQMYKVV